MSALRRADTAHANRTIEKQKKQTKKEIDCGGCFFLFRGGKCGIKKKRIPTELCFASEAEAKRREEACKKYGLIYGAHIREIRGLDQCEL